MKFMNCTLLTGVLFSGILSVIAVAQPQPSLKTRPAATSPAASTATVLPSEDTVNSFLFQMLGFDSTKTWKVTDIRPSEVPGLAEVMVMITDPQGSSPSRLLVSADGKHVLTGEILPFGAKPFEEARAKLEKGLNGPAKGPAKAAVTIVEFSDMQCPHCAKAAPTIDQLLAQEPEAHFVFQSFPLPMHNWAAKAADYVDCVGRASNDDGLEIYPEDIRRAEQYHRVQCRRKAKSHCDRIRSERGRHRRLRSQARYKSESRGLPSARQIGGRKRNASPVYQRTQCPRRRASRSVKEDCGL